MTDHDRHCSSEFLALDHKPLEEIRRFPGSLLARCYHEMCTENFVAERASTSRLLVVRKD